MGTHQDLRHRGAYGKAEVGRSSGDPWVDDADADADAIGLPAYEAEASPAGGGCWPALTPKRPRDVSAGVNGRDVFTERTAERRPSSTRACAASRVLCTGAGA